MTTEDTTPPATFPMPKAPKTASPVPWLTSIHASPERGPYGDPSYRGNCDGFIIRDLLLYFRPQTVFDPMTGSGTCRDVCQDLGIECTSGDLHGGFDACDPSHYVELGPFDFVWLHPPYWRMVKYNDDERCLSNAPTLRAFADRLRLLVRNCAGVLSENGKLAILMGNYSYRGRFMPLTYITMDVCLAEGLWPACTDIIRLQYGNTSSKKTYQSSFIPGLHDVCMMLGKPSPTCSSPNRP